MKAQHSNKTISFLMELIFVLLFFTIASAIAMFVQVNAKEKNDVAINQRNANVYGENLIAQKEDKQMQKYLSLDSFYMDTNGNPTKNRDQYKVTIERSNVSGISKQSCVLHISSNGKSLIRLNFLYDREVD